MQLQPLSARIVAWCFALLMWSGLGLFLVLMLGLLGLNCTRAIDCASRGGTPVEHYLHGVVTCAEAK